MIAYPLIMLCMENSGMRRKINRQEKLISKKEAKVYMSNDAKIHFKKLILP